ncbi:Kinase, NEK [Giardia lamblia P15]|uniref:non-specific serine/threonine protein kinase n=1 Tax=Giardia intestinalis (strain P15) TaxID=658858 RepID=E1F607_GIAIA|nr:Kinase, NEK [Giardia lamblia P15]
MPGQFADRYQELELLGTGNFGKVYKVVERKEGKKFACKEIFLPKLPEDLVDAQMREVTLLKTIRHPNIVEVIDAYHEGDYLYILMPIYSHGDLVAYRKKKNLSEADILIILIQILQALAFLHGVREGTNGVPSKIVHRDIKPANILMGEDDVVVLTDFGLSKILDSMTDTQTVAGSVAYIAPEMHARSAYTEAVDIWSLGVTIYELMTNGKPLINSFFGSHILQEIQQWKRPLVIPNASEDLTRILNLMLAFSPESRPTALELLTMPALQRVRRSLLEKDPITKTHTKLLTSYLKTTPTTYLTDVDEDGNNIVMRCILHGAFHLVSDIVRCFRGEVNAAGKTALMIAAELNATDVIAQLIQPQKGYIDERRMRDAQGKTALMCAAERGDMYEISVKLLKDAEAKLTTPEQWTALMMAAANGSLLIVRQLQGLEAGMTNNTGQTALMIAAAANRVEVVRQLLRFEVRKRDSARRTALMYAAMNGHEECVDILKRYEAKMRDKEKLTALAHAITRRHAGAACLLIAAEEGILIKKQSCYRLAIESNMRDIIGYFSKSMTNSNISAHVDLETSNLSISSVLSVAISACDMSCSALDSHIS